MAKLTKEDSQNRIQKLQDSNPFLPAHQIIYMLLLDDIIACRLEPGTKLTEEQCAALYDSSRTTVRRAFDRLVDEGWLERSQGHRIKISKPSQDDHIEMMEFRMAIEPTAARLAARNRTHKDLQVLKIITEKCNTSDIHTLYINDLKFHQAIFLTSKNQYLMAAYSRIEMKMSWAKLYTMDNFESICGECYQEHLAVYEAIRAGDESMAHKMMFQHIKMMLDVHFE